MLDQSLGSHALLSLPEQESATKLHAMSGKARLPPRLDILDLT